MISSNYFSHTLNPGLTFPTVNYRQTQRMLDLEGFSANEVLSNQNANTSDFTSALFDEKCTYLRNRLLAPYNSEIGPLHSSLYIQNYNMLLFGNEKRQTRKGFKLSVPPQGCLLSNDRNSKSLCKW